MAGHAHEESHGEVDIIVVQNIDAVLRDTESPLRPLVAFSKASSS